MADKSSSLRSLEYYRSAVDTAAYQVSQAVVSGAYNSALGALMHLLNFADAWYSAQNAESGTTDRINLKTSDDRLSLTIHLLLSRRICDLTGKVIVLNAQRRLTTRDSILNKVLSNKKISDTSAALLFRLENVTAAFAAAAEEGASGNKERPDGFPEGAPDSLSFIDTSKSEGYSELVGVDTEVGALQKRIEACRLAKTSATVLLYGPPGTGKTSLIVAAAKENGLPVATITTSNLGGEFIGEREQNTADLFDYLEKVAMDYILFIDEADSFLPETFENNTQSRLTRVLTINRLLRLVNRNDGVTRLVALASNYDDRIARDVSESSLKVYLAGPSTPEQMRDLVSFYRRRANMNMTRKQTDYVVNVALTLGYAPGHVALLMQRMLTNTLIKLLNNRSVQQHVNTDLLEKPMYALEHNTPFEGERTTATVLRVTDVPSADVVCEGTRATAFPIPELVDMDFLSVVGRRTAEPLPQPPTVDSELGPLPLTTFACSVNEGSGCSATTPHNTSIPFVNTPSPTIQPTDLSGSASTAIDTAIETLISEGLDFDFTGESFDGHLSFNSSLLSPFPTE